MAAQSTKIQLDFHTSSLSGDENEKAELTGMLVLASDFIGSSKVNRADHLYRISKVRLPIYLHKTNSGGYLAVNPNAKQTMKVPLMRLPSLSDLTEFCSVPENLDLNKLYNKLRKFQVQDAEIAGGYKASQLKVIEQLLQAPRSGRKDFILLPPVRDTVQLNEDLETINALVYDEKSLKKAIKKRMAIIETALTEEANEYAAKLQERTDYWTHEIANKNQILKKEMAVRDKQLDDDLGELYKKTQQEIKENTRKFLAGVAKNIRSDEKPIEKLIQDLEKLTSKATADNVQEIDAVLRRLSDSTETFRAAVGFARNQVRKTKHKEEELDAMKALDEKSLREVADADKELLVEQSTQKETERDRELKQLKEDREAAKKRVAKFKDLSPDWEREIERSLGPKSAAMLDPGTVRVNNPGKTIEIHIPVYLFGYKKDNDNYYIVVPPLQMPDSMKKPPKNSFHGDRKTVSYKLIVPDAYTMLSKWFEKEAETLDMSTAIQQLPNLLDNPGDLRDTFFNSQSLMVDKLKVNKKSIKAANDRLTEVFASG
ncbi:MAG: hypothetical protein ACW98K_14005 [Candidatus Kariarchaeaceae archaeon]|jgi:hypothetical protein